MLSVYELTRNFPGMDENGYAGPGNWTAITDVGRTFHGERMTLSKFLAAEEAMAQEMIQILNANNISRLAVYDDGWLHEDFEVTVTVHFIDVH